MQQDGLGISPTILEKDLPGNTNKGDADAESGDRAGSLAKSLMGRMLKGQYRIDNVLGQGAMGLVFRGTHTTLGKAVAIKMMRPDGYHTDEARDRFEREATVVSKLLHPSITQVLDFGIDGDMPFLVMEFVDGKELTDVLAVEGPMPPARAVAIVRQLASALEEAHRNGVVHRDIKPQNLRLMRYTPGGQVFLKVLDFGIAKQMDDAGAKGKLTATGAVMGTPMYMAPEQAGGHKVDARADQYALGIVLYELLTGTVPFTGETLTGVLVSHLTKPPPPLPRQVPEPLQKVVMRLLAKSPADRYPDMTELDKALAACESACRDVAPLALGRVQAHVAGGALPTQGSRRAMVLGGVAAATALAMLVFAVAFGPRLRDRRTPGSGSVQPPIANSGSPNTGQSPTVAPPATGPAVPAPPTAGGTGTAPPTPDKLAAKNPPVAKPVQPEQPTTPTTPAKPPARPPERGKPHDNAGTTASTPSGGSYDHEPADVKEKLDEAQKLLEGNDGSGAVEWALRAQSAGGRYARAFRILTMGSCQAANIGRAKGFFHNVAPADRKKVIKFCLEHDKDLTTN